MMIVFDYKQFIMDRNSAFVELVMNDRTDMFKDYCKKYGIPVADNEELIKVSVYKAIHEIPSISEEVKAVAFKKCCDLGFYPFIKEFEKENGNG